MASGESSMARRPSLIPPVVIQPGVEQLDSPVIIPDGSCFTLPAFVKPRIDSHKRKLPCVIAHRGYKAKYPENSMLSFDEALKAGAQALETDVHITKDDVVVLSHDPTLSRCFGRKDKIIDTTWDDIKDLRTIAQPHVSMPRLQDLLEYLAQPGMEEVWILLDIKLDNNADDIMRLIASTIASVEPSLKRRWNERIVLGVWAAKYVPLASKYSPGFPVMHIGFKLSYARHFFSIEHIGFNMLLPILMAPGGKAFIRDCQEKYHRPLLAWTVNERDKMEWCIRRKLDGIITDDPTMFLEVCEQYDEYSKEPLIPVGLWSCIQLLRIYIMVSCLWFLFRKRLNPIASPALLPKEGH